MVMAEKASGRDADKVAREIEQAADRETDRDKKRFHQEAARLLRNPRFREALEGLQNNPGDRDEAKRDPQGYLRRKGIDLPQGATVEFRDQP